MIGEFTISLFDISMSLTDAMDLVSPNVVDHHKKVSYISLNIGKEYGLDDNRLEELVLAGLLHDSGALSDKERIDNLRFELEKPHRHAEVGFQLLKDLPYFKDIAKMIRYHHVPWNQQNQYSNNDILIESQILHLADRLSVLIEDDSNVLTQKDKIISLINKEKGGLFDPKLVDALESLAIKEYFWLDITHPALGERLLLKNSDNYNYELGIDELMEVSKSFRRIIDLSSSFTATHSDGVAITAKNIASRVGFSDFECKMMEIAGYLHDLGKLAIPNKVLDKPGKLDEDEFDLMKNHTYYTFRSLERVPELSVINTWASLHHERLDGKGYPFHYCERNLPLGSKIMAVADVFTAITEERPYRTGMSKDKVIKILKEMSETKKLDQYIVDIVIKDFDYFDQIRKKAQQQDENIMI
ncbi:HD-GYP domain-containing protein [Natranaerobius trueperi]|uniref:Phosphohydrolase n=1 Tax=Natranaerobius trueperi TaxID=759412 RepID=A0A226BXC2_9FIRM|nr:HD domain-containing phosphohydrolase [Natranaerobius trueperi]OWZ82790.1 phosphohydrolase [Natranaerobius trueperi]